jgi:hypothetical protein
VSDLYLVVVVGGGDTWFKFWLGYVILTEGFVNFLSPAL